MFDTGASAGLTPYRCDCAPDYSKVNIKVQGVAGIGDIEGAGTILRRYRTRCGSTVYIPTLCYHMPAADIRLESPQSVIGALGEMVMQLFKDTILNGIFLMEELLTSQLIPKLTCH